MKSPLFEHIAAIRARRAARGRERMPESGWEAIAGTVKDDEHFREVARLGEVWRQEQNERR